MCQCRGSLIKQTNVNIPVRGTFLLTGTYIRPECFPVFHLVCLKSKQDTKQENDLKKASENNQSETKRRMCLWISEWHSVSHEWTPRCSTIIPSEESTEVRSRVCAVSKCVCVCCVNVVPLNLRLALAWGLKRRGLCIIEQWRLLSSDLCLASLALFMLTPKTHTNHIAQMQLSSTASYPSNVHVGQMMVFDAWWKVALLIATSHILAWLQLWKLAQSKVKCYETVEQDSDARYTPRLTTVSPFIKQRKEDN